MTLRTMLRLKERLMLDTALRVSREGGKSLIRQALDIIELKRRNPTMGVKDYFRFRLYDPEYTAASRLEDYLGWRAEQQLALALNPRTVVMPAWDKFTFALIARAFDLPVPKLIGLYRPRMDQSAHVAEAIANTPDALAIWLRTNNHWPVFAKPSYSQGSQGCFYLAGYQTDGDVLVTRRGTKLPVDQFVSDVVGAHNVPFYQRDMGYLFQEVLRPHPQVSRLTGNPLVSSVRVVLIQDEAGIEIVAAVWKIATGQHDTDQFTRQFPGNLLAAVDTETGRVGTVIDYEWRVARVPGAGASTDGFVLPDWDEALPLCRRAAALFPLMRIQHWDVALTDRGPYLLEVNDIGSISGPQGFGRGLLTDRMRALLRSHGDAKKIPWISRLCT
jgi:hypothetical protein